MKPFIPVWLDFEKGFVEGEAWLEWFKEHEGVLYLGGESTEKIYFQEI